MFNKLKQYFTKHSYVFKGFNEEEAIKELRCKGELYYIAYNQNLKAYVPYKSDKVFVIDVEYFTYEEVLKECAYLNLGN